ncbi:hypothetical protein FPRO05_00837 [Fusarium proliferatum]|uniref:Uncharacterized protein n=1 Tax=Gibberella intermedia TaxID=948311 RepID=A0A365NNR6_GIBIN|nr:hypothetical protein FPRO05_00837 [Fusarium proliferatum]
MNEANLTIQADNSQVQKKDVTMPAGPGNGVADGPDSSGSPLHEKGESHQRKPPPLHKKLLEIAEAGQTDEAATSVEFNTLVHNYQPEINAKDSDGKTALHVAIEHGLEAEAQTLIQNGAHIGISDNEGQQPLYLACAEGSTKLVTLLLTKGAIVNSASNDGETPLAAACREDHTKVANILLDEKADTQTSDKGGRTPLHWASLGNHAEIVKRLLEVDTSNINATETLNNWTPLNAATFHDYKEVVSLLLEKNADLYIKDDSDWTPLMTASKMQHTEIVKMILDKKDKWKKDYLEIRDDQDLTPLHVASMEGYDEIASQLVIAGANCNATDSGEMTPLHLASGASAEDVGISEPDLDDPNGEVRKSESKSGRYLRVIQLLLARKADPGKKDVKGETALHRAAAIGDKARIDVLLDSMKSADLSWRDWKASPVYSALGGHDPQAAMESLLGEKKFKEAPFWKDGGRIEVIKNIFEAAKPQAQLGLVGLLGRQVPKDGGNSPEGFESWDLIDWAAYERLPGELPKLLDDSGTDANVYETNAESPTMKHVDSVTRKLYSYLSMLVTLQDILKNPPFAQISRTHRDEMEYKVPTFGPSHENLIAEAEATVVAFFQGKDESGKIRRNERIKEVVYGSGPTQVVGVAIRSLIDIAKTASIPFDSAVYAKENLNFTWVHLPSTNMVWMNDLLTTIMYNENYCTPEYLEVRSFLRDSWIEVPDKTSRSRMMRPQYVSREVASDSSSEGTTSSNSVKYHRKEAKGAHMGEPAVKEVNEKDARETKTTVAGSGASDQKVYDDWSPEALKPTKKPSEPLPASATYMPYLTYSTHCKSLNEVKDKKLQESFYHYEELMEKYDNKQQHGSPTLDEWYYQFAQENDDAKKDQSQRNKSQVVSKYLGESERERITTGRNEWTVVCVNQLWIWTVSNDWIITATSSPFDNSPDILVDEILNLLSKRTEYGGSGAQPVTATKLVPAIIDHCVGSYERRPEKNRISIGQTFSHYINKIGRDETALFDRFRAWSQQEHSTKTRKSKQIKSSLTQYLVKVTKLAAWRTSFSGKGNLAETKQTDQQTDEKANGKADHQSQSQIITEAIDKEKSLYGDIKDVRDELNILKSVAQFQQIVQRGLAGKKVDESRLSSTYVVKDLEELDSIADRIQSAISTTLSLQQSDVANRQATEATKQGKTVMTFTFATVLFLPLSFLSSLFALDVASFQEAPAWAFYVIFFVSIGVSAILGFSVFYWDNIKHPKKMLFDIVKELSEDDSSPTSRPLKSPQTGGPGNKDRERSGAAVSITSKSKAAEPSFRRLFRRHRRGGDEEAIEDNAAE